jgi:UDP-glucose 4-epimerase
MNNKRKILVTGAGGYIGKALVRELLTRGDEVYSLLWSGDPKEKAENGSVSFSADVTRREDLEALKAIPFDTIFHLAARANVPLSVQDPIGDFQSNVIGTLNLLELARAIAIKRFIFLSSVSVLDPTNPLPLGETARTGPSSPYAAGKLASEGYCLAYFRTYGVPTTVVRLFNVYGPGFTRYVIWDLANKILKNPKNLGILGGGDQIRDYLFIDDTVRGIVLAAEKGLPGETYHLASGIPTRIKDLARLIAKSCGSPGIEIVSAGPTWPGDVAAWYADITKIKALGFLPSVSLDSGLTRTVSWIISLQEATSRS